MLHCIRCASSEVKTIKREEVVDFRGLTLEVDGVESFHCLKCGHIWQSEEQAESNAVLVRAKYKLMRDVVREKDGLLTGEQINYILQALDLNKQEAARLFGGGPNAFGKYVSGEVLQSFAMDRLLRLAMSFGDEAVAVLRMGGRAPLVHACRLPSRAATRSSAHVARAFVVVEKNEGHVLEAETFGRIITTEVEEDIQLHPGFMLSFSRVKEVEKYGH
jgi:putative zinc finger/helix-turn-helix YgiT family protein